MVVRNSEREDHKSSLKLDERMKGDKKTHSKHFQVLESQNAILTQCYSSCFFFWMFVSKTKPSPWDPSIHTLTKKYFTGKSSKIGHTKVKGDP